MRLPGAAAKAARAAPPFLLSFQEEGGIRDWTVTGVQPCALPILPGRARGGPRMIGVLPKPGEGRAVHEFFELFKTPWEIYAPGRPYDVVVATADDPPRDPGARVVLIYNSNRTPFDDALNLA